MKIVRIGITGVTPLLMHADTLADPLHPQSKAFKKVSSKRAKTDEDHLEMARLEFLAGLYWSGEAVMVPGANLLKCLTEGARITKSGVKIERGVGSYSYSDLMVAGNGLVGWELEYGGKRGDHTPELLQKDKNYESRMTIKQGMQRIVRTRPIFKEWGFVADLTADEQVIEADDLGAIATTAGRMIGLGDYRKGGGFGRFEAKVLDISPL